MTEEDRGHHMSDTAPKTDLQQICERLTAAFEAHSRALASIDLNAGPRLAIAFHNLGEAHEQYYRRLWSERQRERGQQP